MERNKTVISHAYHSATDLEPMIRLLADLRRRGQRVCPNAADLYEELTDPDVQITVRLWKKDDRLIGFTYISQYQNLVDVFEASEFTPSVENECMSWALLAAQRRNQARGVKLTLDASALADDLPRQAFLERYGFVRQEKFSLLMGRPLDQPIPKSRLPEGFHIRPVGGQKEVNAYVTLHRAAFGTEIMTNSYRQSVMSTPGYIPGLDLVAVSPDGVLAAFCVCLIFPDDPPRAGGQKEGWTDPVGVHPDYRGMGLAKALILTGLHFLRERGIDMAVLGTNNTNTAMQKLAESIGFRNVSTTRWYSKSL